MQKNMVDNGQNMTDSGQKWPNNGSLSPKITQNGPKIVWNSPKWSEKTMMAKNETENVQEWEMGEYAAANQFPGNLRPVCDREW